MNTQSFRTASFIAHKYAIANYSDALKEVRQVGKSTTDIDVKNQCIDMIFDARQKQADQIALAKKEYPFINWTKYA